MSVPLRSHRWLILGLFLGGFVYAWFFTQGVPLWDDDFTSWFWKIRDRNLLSLIGEWVSPISTQPQYWGFNERPLQKIIFKLGYLIGGYNSSVFFLFKNAVYAGLGVMIYLWGLRLVPKTRRGQLGALAAAVFFLSAPGPMAAQVMHQDFAPVAELLFLSLMFLIWGEIEKTPNHWTGLPHLRDRTHRRWLVRWLAISVLTYLSYKSKADLKLIPVIFGLYIFCVRRRQWAFFAMPLSLMGLLAVPWGEAVFHKLPPFVPGSQGSEVNWMWQPASWERLREFFWSGQGYDWLTTLKQPTLSLTAILGPFLCVPLLLFSAGWAGKQPSAERSDESSSRDRARMIVLIWFGAVCLAISALPALNYVFRIRYGILPMVPLSLLLAWLFGRFAEATKAKAAYVAVIFLALQCGLNVQRSARYRHELGQIMIAVDQVYERVARSFPSEKLTLLPDFRPYDYRPDAPSSILEKQGLASADELVKKNFVPGHTYVVSWSYPLWDRFELVENYTGCRENTVFDRLFQCPSGTGAFLMRYVEADPLFAQGEDLRSRGDWSGARKAHELFVSKHPQDLAGYFSLGLDSYGQKDWVRAEEAFSQLEIYLPENLGVLYNHALAFEQLKKYALAIPRLLAIVAREPRNYEAGIHLYANYRGEGEQRQASEILSQMKRDFPNDPEVNRLQSE